MLKIDLENHFYDQSVINALAERTEPPYCTSDHSSIQWTNLIDMPQEKLLPLLLDVGEMQKKKDGKKRNFNSCHQLFTRTRTIGSSTKH